jgi:hypothetical protein
MSYLGKKIILTILSGLLVLTGIFCFSNMNNMSNGCTSDMHSSVWCSDIVEHGTLISATLAISIFFIVAVLINFIFLKKISLSVKKIFNNIIFEYQFEDFNPVVSLFSKGILNPKKP